MSTDQVLEIHGTDVRQAFKPLRHCARLLHMLSACVIAGVLSDCCLVRQRRTEPRGNQQTLLQSSCMFDRLT